MRPPVPRLHDYGIRPDRGFLPPELPLEKLPYAYYEEWETIATNLQPLILSKRLRGVVQQLPVLSTSKLNEPEEWRRAYVVLAFITHAYIWGGDRPADVCGLPLTPNARISIDFDSRECLHQYQYPSSTSATTSNYPR